MSSPVITPWDKKLLINVIRKVENTQEETPVSTELVSVINKT